MKFFRYASQFFFLCIFGAIFSCAEITTMNPHQTIDNSASNNNRSQFYVEKIAILVEPKKNIPDDHIESLFIEGLRNKGYVISTRSDLTSVMREQTFQRSGLTEGEAAKIGKILKAEAVLIVKVTELNIERTDNGQNYISKITMAAKLIDVESCNVMWIKSKSNRSSILLQILSLPKQILVGQNSEIDDICNTIISEFPSR